MPLQQHPEESPIARLAEVPFADREAAARNLERAAPRLSPWLINALPALLVDSPDPDSALLLLDRLVEEAPPEILRLIERHRPLAHYAIAVFGNSRFLGETLLQHPDLFHSFLREKNLDRSFSHEEFSEALARFRSRSLETDVSLLLARFKRREYVRIMLRDVLRIAPLAETTAEISALSDVLIEDALREAERIFERRFGLPQHFDREGRTAMTPFTVLSLGKLGGNELNYSSDIDLLYLYGDGQEPPGAPISNREYFVRLAQQTTEILSRPTAEGAVFRIDLRLRPQGNEGELAISLANALRYYRETAHDWERQALIKVRHSAGDLNLAREFIHRVEPQVYREQIHFAAIKTALVAREKIDRKRRLQAAVEGNRSLDVKIDRGGIRDIEFLVQCLQRVYGGREPWLRAGGTLFSLQKLHDKGHISGHDFHELTSAYSFLRHLEHRLQLRQGQQVHRLPTATHELEILERALAALTPGYLLTDLAGVVAERMTRVAEIYQRVIYQQQGRRPLAPREGEYQLETLPESAIVDQSHEQLVDQLSRDAPELARVLRQETSAVGRRQLLRYLNAAYGTSERYAALVRWQKSLALAAELFETSEYLVEVLVRYPEEIETLGEIRSTAPPSGAGLFPSSVSLDEFGLQSCDPAFDYIARSPIPAGEKAALLRRHFRHRMFAAGARDLIERRSVYASLAETSDAAEQAIAAAFRLAGAPRGLAILALGRLGTREFDLLSDADLLFVSDPDADRPQLTKAAEEMIQALAAYTQEGLVFAVDTRLRPRGAEGELVVTPAHLGPYFAAEAQSWEALSYTKLHFVAGSAPLARQAIAESQVLFQRFAADPLFPTAVREMRQKLEQASAPGPSIRTSPGALYDVDFLVSFLMVKYRIQPPAGTVRDRLWRSAARGALEKRDAAALDHAAEFFRTVEHVMRLVGGRNTRWLPSAEHARAAVENLTARVLRREFPEGLEKELMRSFSEVRAVYERIVR